jgi:predicted RNA-binding Zn-ribbon protein involved in translation (DUF1610 family)
MRDSLGCDIRLKKHTPYLESDWLRDNGKALPCPDCGSARDFGTRCAPKADGGNRLYRACKDCGFWQEADGSPPYRTWKSEHACNRKVYGNYPCPFCGTELQGLPDGKLVTHPCGKYLLPSEAGYQCTTCGQWRGRDTQVPWPRAGSG